MIIALGRCTVLSVVASLAIALPSHAQTVSSSGIDRAAIDPAVRPQDDMFRAFNGRWIATTEIPADRSSYGTGARLVEATQVRLREILDGLPAGGDAAPADARKVADFYQNFMDEARADRLGVAPLKAEFARIDAIRTRSDVVAEIARIDILAADSPFVTQIHQDAKDATRYIVDLNQGGIGVPNRDYLIVENDPRFADIRKKYQAFLAVVLARAGEKDADEKAAAVLAFETAIARVQWDAVAVRDPVKAYNPTPIADLKKLAPHIDWTRYLAAAQINGRTKTIIVSQPGFVTGIDRLVETTPIATWKAYFKTRLLSAFGPLLDSALVDARFDYFQTTLRGTPRNQDRWKRGVALIDTSMGESLGRLFVAKYFPPENKARMDTLVRNLLAAYKTSIDGLDWMGPETKKEAQAKLATFMPKIGYPTTWRDYGSLVVRPDDLVGNVVRAREFEYRRNLAKLGRPIDRAEWGMTPQTIDAYYNPELNEIVFPAGILQPPFFDAKADDAANYGSIGAIIGHEISHGFDDQGSQYDEKGQLRDWWTADDHRRFAEKTKALVDQYNGYEPVAGYHINGALTLGENIADNSGLAIAYKAYRLSLGGKPAPVIDGMTGDQRFYAAFAQGWQRKSREAALVAQVKSDPHSAAEFRANGSLVNQPGFYDAFDVKPGDKMYRAPEQRVIIW